MAGPGGREVGRVSIRAVPETSNFARSLERYLERLERRLEVEVPVDLDSGDVAGAEATLNELARTRKAKIEVDVDSSVADRLGGVLGGIGGAAGGGGGLGRGIGRFGPGQILAIGAAVAVLGSTIGVLIAALPGMLSAVVSPLGAIVLGFEGIKDAAVLLAEPLQEMQAAVSDVFRYGLAPVFRDLRDIFPTLTVGFSSVADSIVRIADSITGALTSDRGLRLIGETFDHIADAFAILAPAMGPLTDSMMTLANEGAAAFERWAPKIAEVIEGFNGIIRKLEENGALADAFDALGAMIYGIVLLFGALVVWSIISFAIVKRLATGAAELFGKIGDGFAVLKETIDRIAGAVADRFLRLTLDLVTTAAALPEKIRGALGDLSRLLFNAGVQIIMGLIDGVRYAFETRAIPAIEGMALGLKIAAQVALGINSPSKVFRDIGHNVGDGFVLGVEDRLGSVERSFRRLAIPNVGAVTAPDGGADGLAAAMAASRPLYGDVYVADGSDFLRKMHEDRLRASLSGRRHSR